MPNFYHKPNFFILGAPKCGTSAMAEYLRTHPDVFFSRPKEPDYFNTDFSDRWRKIHTEDDYLRLFSGAAGSKAAGEGSVWYLYSRQAVPNILKFNPDAKFIVMVRNPVDMAYSLYFQHRKSKHWPEDIENFEAAWDAQAERLLGRRLPQGHPEPRLLQYGEICRVGGQIERLYSLVPSARVKIIFFDDLQTRPDEVYRSALRFLGLPNDGRVEFPVVNQNAVPVHPRWRQFFSSLGRTVWKIKRRLGIDWKFGIFRALEGRTIAVQPRPSLRREFRERLVHYFADDIQKLSRFSGRDLSRWML